MLDVGLPGVDGLTFCRRLKDDPDTKDIRIVLLTGREDVEAHAEAAGADALLLKPFRPLELLAVVERLAAGRVGLTVRRTRARTEEEQLLLYARDLRQLLELERGQRALLESAYRETVSALAAALESKDTGTKQHSQRVQHYALALAAALDPLARGDPSVEYGFLLHDIGKIGIPDQVLRKPSALTEAEWRLMQTHASSGRRCSAPLRSCAVRASRSSARTTSAGTAAAIPTDLPARTSRSGPESSPSPTRSTR